MSQLIKSACRQPYRPVASRTPRSIAALRSHVTVPVASKNSEIGITPVLLNLPHRLTEGVHIRHTGCLCGLNNNKVKPVLSGHSKRRPNVVFKTDYRLMQVKSIAECSKGILQYFRPSISYHLSIKIFVLSIFEWPLKTGFTVDYSDQQYYLGVKIQGHTNLKSIKNCITDRSVNPSFIF